MVENLQDYLCKYMQQQTEALKGCLIGVFDSREHYLSLLDESLGTPTGSNEIKLCELLANSGLLREEIRVTRDGRNRYKVFYLTEPGLEMAKRIKQDGFNGPLPLNTPIDNI